MIEAGPADGSNSMKDSFMRFVAFTTLALLLISSHAFSAETPKEKIAFAYAAISPSMSGVWMAKEIGAFDRNGLSAELVHISSGATAIQALVGGSVQAALGASNAVVAATIKGAPIIAVGSNTSRPGMQLWVQPEIQRAEQLQGKTLAITRFGSTSDFVTRLIMRKLNLEGKTELRQFGGVVEADVGFRAGQAEGRVSSQAPGPKAKMLVDAAELGIPFSMNLLAVSNDFYRRSPKTVERIVASYIEGIAALKTRKPAALKLLEKYMGQRGGSAEQHYDFVSKYLDAVPRVDPAAVETVLEMVGQKGPPKAQLYDNAIVDRLVQEGFIDRLYKGGKS
jgi:ABC-type nitrate/sulfonate/bicarbonate transport system substrate-binding protein